MKLLKAIQPRESAPPPRPPGTCLLHYVLIARLSVCLASEVTEGCCRGNETGSLWKIYTRSVAAGSRLWFGGLQCTGATNRMCISNTILVTWFPIVC